MTHGSRRKGLDYAKEARRRAGAAAAAARLAEGRREVKRKNQTVEAQRAEIRALCEQLGRPEPESYPKMAYDARLEIQRLTLLLESKLRREARA